mmetsp:Transcript_6931/g.8996  ORF Transcript_6931/g.8996 Transcript_6931/m.8996 type:complete len:216 (+) Transcript_6931:167-814(+)
MAPCGITPTMMLLEFERDYGIDDLSDCSTLMADSPVKKRHASKNPKRVRFHENFNQSHRDVIRSRAICDTTWYDEKDYKRFKADRARLVNGIIQDDLDAIEQNASSYLYTLENLFAICFSVNTEVDDKMPLFTQRQENFFQNVFSGDLHGLESASSNCIFKDKFDRRQHMKVVVYEIQSQCLFVNSDTMDVMIRRACEEISRPSRLFAQLLGKLA